MEDISAAAGVGKGTLYRYFKDKEELYLALLDRASAQVEERMTAAVAQATDPARNSKHSPRLSSITLTNSPTFSTSSSTPRPCTVRIGPFRGKRGQSRLN